MDCSYCSDKATEGLTSCFRCRLDGKSQPPKASLTPAKSRLLIRKSPPKTAAKEYVKAVIECSFCTDKAEEGSTRCFRCRLEGKGVKTPVVVNRPIIERVAQLELDKQRLWLQRDTNLNRTAEETALLKVMSHFWTRCDADLKKLFPHFPFMQFNDTDRIFVLRANTAPDCDWAFGEAERAEGEPMYSIGPP